MRILVLGGGGPIGQAAVRRIRARGDDAIWISRRSPVQAASGHITADRACPEDVAAAVRQVRPDALVDMVAYDLADTTPLLAVLEGLVPRYIMVSSGDVYRNYGLLHRKEAGAPDLGPLTEDAPLRASRHPYRAPAPRPADASDRWMDDYDKIPLEEAVRRLSSGWTILRLPMVYGPGDRQRRFRWITAPMIGGASILEAPAAWLDRTTTYGFVENVGEAIALAAVHPSAPGRVFNVADEAPIPHRVWIDRFATITGWRGEVRATTDPEHPMAQATAALDLDIPFTVSAERLARELGYAPPIAPMEAARLALTN